MAMADASPSLDQLLGPTKAFVQTYMAAYDSSHDFAHIERVVSLAVSLASTHPAALRRDLVILAAYLHDIGDAKYANAADDATPARTFLLSVGAADELATAVQTIVSHVSFSKEKKNPQAVQEVLCRYPELAVVQDADRLDALGAIGIGRCFTYGATRAAKDRASGKEQDGSSMDNAIMHFGDKLELLESMMKTERGKYLARQRTDRLVQFKKWWLEEASSKIEVNGF